MSPSLCKPSLTEQGQGGFDQVKTEYKRQREKKWNKKDFKDNFHLTATHPNNISNVALHISIFLLPQQKNLSQRTKSEALRRG